MKRAMREGLLFSTLVVVFAALVTASCGATHKTPVNGPANGPEYGMMNGAGYGPAYGPVPTSTATSPTQPSYLATSHDTSSPSEFEGYNPVKVRLPKRYGYIDGTNGPPSR